MRSLPADSISGSAEAKAAPRVSVVMPAYNSHDTIRESVESVLAQSEDDLELIVVDDGSPEPLEGALTNLVDKRVQLVRHDRNRGIPAARNTGLRLARAGFLAYLDSDDLWEPEYVRTVLPRFADPAIGLVYANATVLGHPMERSRYIRDEAIHPIDRFPRLAEGNRVCSATVMMRTAAVRRTGGYRKAYRIAQDYDMYIRLALDGWRFAYVPEALARYRWPDERRGISANVRATELELLRLWFQVTLRHPLTPGPRYQLRMRVTRELQIASERWRGAAKARRNARAAS